MIILFNRNFGLYVLVVRICDIRNIEVQYIATNVIDDLRLPLLTPGGMSQLGHWPNQASSPEISNFRYSLCQSCTGSSSSFSLPIAY